jgi:hypothetical protein
MSLKYNEIKKFPKSSKSARKVARSKKPYANNLNFEKRVLKHYAHNRFSEKVLWIFFLLF